MRSQPKWFKLLRTLVAFMKELKEAQMLFQIIQYSLG